VVNAQAYILDRQLRPATIGVAGELYLGGAGVGRGYLNRPELTAERFIANPFIEYQRRAGLEVPQDDRLYKTGDLARYLPGGFLEYAGRIDFQVKLRGFRIELGEIENVLMETPGIKEAVVIVREDEVGTEHPAGNKQLVAYLVADQALEKSIRVEPNPTGDDAPALGFNISSLRNQLKARLPEYMVPGVFVFMDALPLTPNRKVDRKALPKPEGLRPELAAEYQAPRSEREKVLANIWAQVLKLDKVGVRDNFFDLGGDSILSIQVVSRANQAGMRLTPRQIFEAQTVESLAAMADQAAQQPLAGARAEQGLAQGPVELTPIQRMYFEGNPVNPNYMNQAILLEVRQPLRPGPLQAAVEAVVKQHDALRLRFEQESGGWKQFYDPSQIEHSLMKVQPVMVEVPQAGGADTEAFMLARINDFQVSLDIREGPLLRVVYFDWGYARPGRLFIVIHHLAVDGISWRILVEDLLSAYEQASQGVKIDLPLKTNSYQEWAARLAEYARAKPVEDELDYWLTTARTAAEAGWNRLPLDIDLDGANIEPVNLESSLSSVRSVMSEAKTQALLREAPAAYNTEIGDLLLTALAHTIQQWKSKAGWLASDRNGVQIALEGHGREDIGEIDVTRTVGWFTSLYPVNLELPNVVANWPVGPVYDVSHGSDEMLGTNLMAIKEQIRQIPQKGIGYGLLRYLNPKGSELGRLPIGQLSFNYLGQVDAEAAVDDFGKAHPLGTGFANDAPFKLANESTGLVHDPNGKRNFVIDVVASVVKNQLRVEWQYSQNLHQPATIEYLANQFMEELEYLIVHCTARERQYATSAAGYTPSDFPEAELSQAEIEELMDELAAEDSLQEDEE
jgi:fengycin family lipopeptide synthetase B